MPTATKTITFDFYFKYPHKGQYGESNCITVCEPGYEQRDVYRKMRGYVAEAQKGLIKMNQGSRPEEAPKSDPTESKEIVEIDAFLTMSLGLSIDQFTDFCEFVQRSLTNRRGLAFVGADPTDRVPITEEVWMNIADAGGMESLEKGLAGFADFFLGGPAKSPTKTGTSSSSTSPSSPPASSPTRKRS